MLFEKTNVNDCYVVSLEKKTDERGFFARFFCEQEFEKHGLETQFPQINTSYSEKIGTLRGMHYQTAPNGEAKLIRCIQGEIFDVIVDLRKSSSTFGEWVGISLDSINRKMAYVPVGCAHGFLSLKANTEVIYLSSSPFSPQSERTIRWDDPRFGIKWPIEPIVMSDKDRSASEYIESSHKSGY